MNVNMSSAIITPEAKPAPLCRCYQTSRYIMYHNDKEPHYIGVTTYYEQYNQQKGQWELTSMSQKLYYTNGRPVGGV